STKAMIKTSTISKLGIIALIVTVVLGIAFASAIEGHVAFLFRVAITAEILLIALGIVIDRLQRRGFQFWMAGAVVAYLGFLLLFSPLILYAIGLESVLGANEKDQLLWSAGLSLAGGLVVLFGYFVEAYDLNKRFVRMTSEIIELIRRAEYRKIPGRVIRFVAEIFRIILSYVWRGITGLKAVLERFFAALFRFVREYALLLLAAIRAIPGIVKSIGSSLYEAARANAYVFVLVGGFGAIYLYVPHLLIGMGSITLFMAGLFFAYPRQERLGRYIQGAQDRAWNAAWQTQAMVHRIRRRKVLCKHCGKHLDAADHYCASCGQEAPRCQVCRLHITLEQAISLCSNCESPFHEAHWQQWQRMGKGCPVCRDLPNNLIKNR
ncbi:MAG: hypothetical protein ACXADX_19195, partial [Candidatus Hodarchaeales archaeon]